MNINQPAKELGETLGRSDFGFVRTYNRSVKLRPRDLGRPSTWLFLLLGICLITGTGLAQDHDLLYEEPEARPEAITKAGQILGSRYQTELPEIKEFSRSSAPPAILPDIFVKTALVIGIVLVGLFLFNAFYSGGKFDPSEDDDALATGGPVDFSRLKVPDPDQLAGAGNFSEAIHALLLRSLVLVSQRTKLAWPRSLTSREILRFGQLPDPAKENLGQLVKRVEIHHFGGLEPVDTDFKRCKEIYQKLAADLEGGTS